MINSIEYENSENEDNIRQMFLIWAYWTLVCIFWIGFAIFATSTDLIYGVQEKTRNHSIFIYMICISKKTRGSAGDNTFNRTVVEVGYSYSWKPF